MKRLSPSTPTPCPQWDTLRAQIDLASERWGADLALTRQGIPASQGAIDAVVNALLATERAALWAPAERAAARVLELKNFERQRRVYLRRDPIHWSFSRAALVAKSQGGLAAGRGALAAFSVFCTNLLPASPHTHSPRYERHDVGGGLLNLASKLRDGGPNGGSSGSDALRDRVLLAHGSWCSTLAFASVGDYYFGANRFGWGTWFDQWSSADASSAAARWGDQLLAAARAQITLDLPAPSEATFIFEALSVSMPNHAASAASGGMGGAAEWSWALRFPLPLMDPDSLKLLRKTSMPYGLIDPIQGWDRDDTAQWESIAMDAVERSTGPGSPQALELAAAHAELHAFRESKAIAGGLVPASREKPPSARPPRL